MNLRAPSIPPAAVAALRRAVAGRIAYPADPAYDSLVPDPPTVDGPRPAAVVVAADEDDVAAAVQVARAHGLALADGATSHAPGLLVLTGRLDQVSVDVLTGAATVGAAATWAVLVEEAGRQGLRVPAHGPATGTVASSVLAGELDAVALRVVRSDGFVDVVDVVDTVDADLRDLDPSLIVTAVVVLLRPATTPPPALSPLHPVPERTRP